MKSPRSIPPPIGDHPHEVISQEQVWYYLGLSKEELREAMKSGRIPYRQRGHKKQMLARDVEAYIESTILGAQPRVTSYAPSQCFTERDLDDLCALM